MLIDNLTRTTVHLLRLNVQLLGSARTQHVHHQQDQVAVRNLLHAEWPLAAGRVTVGKFSLQLI